METSIREQAAHWLTELPDLEPGGKARFAAWLKESPRHVEEFLFFHAIWKELDYVDVGHRIDLPQLLAEARSAQRASRVVPLQNLTQRFTQARRSNRSGWIDRARRLRPRWVAAGIGALALAFVLSWSSVREESLPLLDRGLVHETRVGEQRTVKLDDGSAVYLNTGSRVAVSYSARARDVVLLDGEALFTVRRDSKRPFRVRAGNAVVQALGTQFNVYRREQDTMVSVIEGAVQISEGGLAALIRPVAALPARLTAGEQAEVSSRGEIVKRAAPNVAKAVAWRARRLVFNNDTLETVAAEFNRYNTLKIRVESEAARGRRLIATFDADDPESLATFLGTAEDLRVERDGEALVIRSR